MNVKSIRNVAAKSLAKISDVNRHALNAAKVLNVHECRIIGPFVNVQRDTLAVRTLNAELNVMAIVIVLQVDQHAIMEFVKIHVMVLVELVLIAT